MAGQRVLLVGEHGVVGHAGEEIVGLVVFAHMLEAVMPAAETCSDPWARYVGRLVLAARPLANRTVVLDAAVLVRLDANAIEKSRRSIFMTERYALFSSLLQVLTTVWQACDSAPRRH